MDLPTPSFQDIIQCNKLIKGRLKTPVKSLEKLHRILLKENIRITKQVERENELIRSHLKKRTQLNIKLKRNAESILKSFYPSADNISLLYKKQGTSTYIKGRLYWEGIQREVQVGSIPRVIEMINILIEHKVISDLNPLTDTDITWELLTKNPQMLQAVKEVAALKFQEYILRKLATTADLDENEIVRTPDDQSESPPQELTESPPTHKQSETEEIPTEGTDWYIQWRENNL